MVGKDLNQASQRAATIADEIQELQKGDRVLVVWHDACRVTNDPDVRPDYYSTRKETQGTVWDCVPDPEYPWVLYLIIAGETTSGRPDYYDAIPVAWIARVQRLTVAVKLPRKMTRASQDTYQVNRVIVFRNGKPHEDSGGVDKVPKKWAHDGTCKLVEEIIKVIQ